jgi:hypothetical protein
MTGSDLQDFVSLAAEDLLHAHTRLSYLTPRRPNVRPQKRREIRPKGDPSGAHSSPRAATDGQWRRSV